MHGSRLAFSILQHHIPAGSLTESIYLPHVTLVTNLALKIARKQGLSESSLLFIEEAGLLHDIGIIRVHDPEIGCFGEAPYIQHGILGREILDASGLSAHGLVAERHTGVGITVEDIREQNLPLPERSFVPQTEEEIILCYADLFFSKDPHKVWIQKSVEEVRSGLMRFGAAKVQIFDTWSEKYGL